MIGFGFGFDGCDRIERSMAMRITKTITTAEGGPGLILIGIVIGILVDARLQTR
jgi:hypothetical protein